MAFTIVILQIFSLNVFAIEQDDGIDEIIFHVDANANLYGDGSITNPFKTVEEAKKNIAKIKHSNKIVRVKVHGGIYYLQDSISFTGKDSGYENYPVIYEAAGDGEVVFKGSREIDFTQFKPITDPDMIARLSSPKMLNYIGVIDLKAYGFTSDMIDFVSKAQNTNATITAYPSVLGVYLNGQRQTLAKYPNVGYLKIESLVKEGGRWPNWSQINNGDVIKIPKVSNMERWIEAPDVQIQGYISAEYARDWRQIKSIDVKNRELTFLNFSGMAPRKNGRFQILNLLEELDMPGEWYIDKKTCNMYYYPSHGLRVGRDSLTIASFESCFVNFEGAKYITLRGFTFEENSNNGIMVDSNSENITILNCNLKNIGGMGISLDGKNNLVSGCRIENTSKRGVTLLGGDMATLTHGNNEVSNCHFYNTGIDGGGNADGGVRIEGCGNKFKFNTMHHIENYPISFYSCECEITNNEIFNNIRNTADAAVIYTGRSFLYQGNKIQYNFLHDNVMFDYSSGLGSHAIAYDDWASGNDASWNIIYMGKKTGTVTGAARGIRDSSARYNTTICSTTGNSASDGRDVLDVFAPTGNWAAILKQVFNNSQKFDTSNEKWRSKYSSYDDIIEDIKNDNNQLLPRNTTYKGNLAVDCVKTEIYGVETLNPKNNNCIEGNVSVDTYDVFVDPERLDYRVKVSAIEEYGIDSNVLNENNWNMDWMGVQEDVLKLEIPNKSFNKIYPRNGAETIMRDQAIISWEPAEYADEYYYVLATDKDLKNVVAEGRTMDTNVKIDGLKHGQSYYWNVWAKNISRKYSNEWVSSETPYLFSIATYDILDKTDLNAGIKKAEELLNQNIVEVSEPTLGEYKEGTITALKEQIDIAKKEYAMFGNFQYDIDNAYNRIEKFLADFDCFKYQGYENVKINSADDVNIQAESCNVTYNNGIIKVEPISPGVEAHISLNKDIEQSNSVVRFRLKLDSINGFSCVSVRNTEPTKKTYATSAYSVVLKPEVIEFQKGSTVIKTCENDVKKGPVKEGEWHEWEIITADVLGGVECRLLIDGKEIIHFIDENNSLHQKGTLVINTYKEMTFELQGPEHNINGFYEPDMSFLEDNDNIIRDKTSNTVMREGTFSESSIKDYDSEALVVSNGEKAKVELREFFETGYYKVSYYHTAIENGDKTAEITIESGGGIEGSTKHSVPVDFSKGTDGWIDLGTVLIMGIDGVTGQFVLTISSDGGGTIPVSAIKLEHSTEEQKEITDAMYTKNYNVLLLKPDSKKAYKNMNELEMQNAAVIENGRTLVPLRFISEAFNCDVKWIDGEKKVVITKDDNIINFVIGNSYCTVNGEDIYLDQPAVLRDDSTMVPIRAISDALKKQCFWDDSNRLIFICDEFGLKAEDDRLLTICAKLFN